MTGNNYQFRIDIDQWDSHVHFKLYIASRPNTTYALTGSLVMRIDEFVNFMSRFINQEDYIFSPSVSQDFKDQVIRMIIKEAQ